MTKPLLFVTGSSELSFADTLRILANQFSSDSILGASLTLSLIATSMDIYSIVRLLSIIAPPSFPLRRRLDALRDMRIVRGSSLLVFDLIVLVPTGIPTNLLGDSLPFSVAAMIVLSAIFCFAFKAAAKILQTAPYL